MGEDLIRKILILLSLCNFAMAISYDNDSLKYGDFGRIGIGIGNLVHQAGQSRSQSVFASLYIEGGYTFANQIEILSNVQMGSSPNKLSNGLPLVGIDQFTGLPTPKGGRSTIIDFSIHAGYNFISSSSDHPLYLGTGITFYNLTSAAINMPVAPGISNVYLPLEIKGNIIRGKWGIEYLAGYDLLLKGAVAITGELQEEKQISIDSGYAFRTNLGFTYTLSKKIFFYTTLIFRYESLKASQKTTITTISTNLPGIKPNTGEVYYPKSHTTYAGVRFGFGY